MPFYIKYFVWKRPLWYKIIKKKYRSSSSNLILLDFVSRTQLSLICGALKTHVTLLGKRLQYHILGPENYRIIEVEREVFNPISCSKYDLILRSDQAAQRFVQSGSKTSKDRQHNFSGQPAALPSCPPCEKVILILRISYLRNFQDKQYLGYASTSSSLFHKRSVSKILY